MGAMTRRFCRPSDLMTVFENSCDMGTLGLMNGGSAYQRHATREAQAWWPDTTARSASRKAVTCGSVPIVIRHQVSNGGKCRPTWMLRSLMDRAKCDNGIPVSKNTKLPCGSA